MANIQHNALTDPNLHEPKGIAGASSNQIYVSDGSGSGAWTSKTALFAQGHFSGNSTATTITAVDTPVSVNFGSTMQSDDTSGFSISPSGTVTCSTSGSRKYLVIFNVTCVQTSGVAALVSFSVSKNGSPLSFGKTKITTNGTDIGFCSVVALVDLTTSDTVSLSIENNTDDGDITVQEGNMSVSVVGF